MPGDRDQDFDLLIVLITEPHIRLRLIVLVHINHQANIPASYVLTLYARQSLRTERKCQPILLMVCSKE